jgi:hypothetical protein
MRPSTHSEHPTCALVAPIRRSHALFPRSPPPPFLGCCGFRAFEIPPMGPAVKTHIHNAPAAHQRASGPLFDRRRPHCLDCRFDGSGWVRSSGPCRSPRVLHSLGVLRSGAGTILLSGAHRPIASFGSPEVHNLSWGTRANRPSPEFQWMLSPETGSLSVRRTRLPERNFPPHARRSRPGLLRSLQLRRIVPLARTPQRQCGRGDLTRDRQLRQVRFRAAVQ